ncbi:hypothetical protein PP654_gp058 [Bacillus phage v_B-Bak10]|uniref:Uncharacterized protein n=1 Tax=Bacillus phage v_B-Bak10 TaxID=2094736 RepID=A0A385IK50_9CAUD|nr:hypothetical protein PP654_gp058 [Bacillus phage v_B-Bak10]AXY83273.1 hypothetical protein vBBBak10_084 [Bacillus phage v_B-Bak10]
MAKKDNYIRKPLVFNKKSAWHMEIHDRIENESDNFSGYCMSILKMYFDNKPKIEKKVIAAKEKTEPQKKEVRKVNNRKEDTVVQPINSPTLFKKFKQ